MKIGSISGVEYRVKNLERTVQFYESLGFRTGKRDDHEATCYINWFWVRFVESDDAAPSTEEQTLYLKVDDIDDAYGHTVAQGLLPATEPRTQRNGGPREFRIEDPDGHRLALFAK